MNACWEKLRSESTQKKAGKTALNPFTVQLHQWLRHTNYLEFEFGGDVGAGGIVLQPPFLMFKMALSKNSSGLSEEIKRVRARF